MTHYRSSSETQPGTEKLSLPNFTNFLAGAGRPDLAYRTEVSPNNVAQNATFSPQSLPTPPGTSCYTWPVGEDGRRQSQLDSTVNMTESQAPRQPHEHNLGSTDYRRRSSANIPMVPSHDNRSTRSYSYTISGEDRRELNAQQHGRIVREEIIPGKGLCYVYDDGTVCPKIVNGDTVNPKWGTTKAGKPRKRLGQACNTCREKKIKCDPSYPKCTQCQKLGRECKFEAPSRPGQKSPKSRTSGGSPMSAYIPEEALMTRRSSTTTTEASTPTETNSNAPTKSSMNVNDLLSPSSTEIQISGYQPSPTKRLRLNPPEVNPGLAPSPVDLDAHDSQGHLKMFGFRSDLDPIHVDRKLVEHYLEVYFTKANVPAFGMFPPTAFCEWARTEPKKEQDMMVIYAVLALATIFSKNSDRLLHRQAFKTIAHLLLSQHVYSLSLQTVQAGHLLSLVEFADGDHHQSFSLGRQAAGAASWLGLNTEVVSTPNEEVLYGFSPTQFAECKRRSFWAVYITERFGGACLGHPLAIQQLDVFLRLPCDPSSYDSDRIPQTPLFDSENVVSKLNKAQAHHQLATMAHLAQIATLCSEVQTIAKRMKQSLTIGRPNTDSGARKKLEQQLTYWDEGYQLAAKARERDTRENDESTGRIGGRSEKLSGLHLLYHFAHMALNRQIYHPKLSKQDIASHVRKTHSHAMRTLEIAQQLVSRGCVETIDYGFTSTAPLTAFAVFTAIDVITATGTISDVLENQSRMMQLLYSGIELLGQLAEYWVSAKLQHKVAQERCQIMFTRVSASLMERKIAFCLSTPLSPMSAILGMDFDLIYGIGRMQYLQALGWANEITNENELLEIDVSPENLAQRGSRHAPSKSSSF